MDSKLEILNVKEENLELTVDSLVEDLNACMQQACQKKEARGKQSISHSKKEAFHMLDLILEKFGKASSDLKATLNGAKEALTLVVTSTRL